MAEQRRVFKRKRGGVVLSREEVKEIKAGRKKLRKDLKSKGIKSKKEFEIIAAGLGLYFDKRNGLLFWFLYGRGLWALLGALAALMAAFFLMSLVSQMRGHFTINLSSGMFRDGFVLSETEDFADPRVNLFCEPAVDVPCISVTQIDEEIFNLEGQNNAEYFAYTFYCRNEGENTVDYSWTLELIDESKNLSDAIWVMVFVDDEMTFYAEPNSETGEQEALPAFDDDGRGYIQTPFRDQAQFPDRQYEVVREKNGITYYRLVPENFISYSVVTEGTHEAVAPMDVHKYTVVIWLEGDDPDCDNDKIGGHLGLAMQFRLLEEAEAEEERSWWDSIWDNLESKIEGGLDE